MDEFNYKKFILKNIIFIFFSILFIVLVLDFIVYRSFGMDFTLFKLKNIRTVFIQLLTLIIAVTIIYQFVKQIKKINKSNYLEKIEKYERRITILLIIVDTVGFTLGITFALLIRAYIEQCLFWSSLRLILFTYFLGPIMAILHITYFKNNLENIRTHFQFYEIEHKKSFLSLKYSIILTILAFGLLVIVFFSLFTISREEIIVGVNNKVVVKTNKVEKFEGYFTELLEASKNSTDKKVANIANKIYKNWSKDSINNSVYIFLISFSLILIFIFFIYTFATNISTHINSIKNKLKLIIDLEGDLSQMVIKTRKDEIGELQILINQLILNLNKKFYNIATVISNVIEKSNSEKDKIHSLVNYNQDMKDFSKISKEELGKHTEIYRKSENMIKETISLIENNVEKTTNLSAMIEEISASQTEMTSSIHSISNMTKEADSLGNRLKIASKQGNESIDDMKSSISNISKIGSSIFDILTTITSITEQTDILAMNAAIEAAHAGEAGKGFGVVADEIRKLAENTSEQTKGISLLLNNMTSGINDMVEKSEVVSVSITNMIKDIDSAIDLISEIDNATKEQSYNSNENLKAIDELVRSTTTIMNNLDKHIETNKNLTEVIEDINNSTHKINDIGIKQDDYLNNLDSHLSDFFKYLSLVNDNLDNLYSMTKDIKFIDKDILKIK